MTRLAIARTFTLAMVVGTLGTGCGPTATPPTRPRVSDEDAKTNLLAQARKAADATVAEDWDTLIALTHPKVVKLSGGPAKMRQGLSKEFSDDFKLTKCGVGEPGKFYEADGDLFALVPTPLVIRTGDGKTLAAAGNMLGISTDGGRTWTFVSAGGTNDVDRAKLKTVVPNLPDDLTFPKGTPPMLISE